MSRSGSCSHDGDVDSDDDVTLIDEVEFGEKTHNTASLRGKRKAVDANLLVDLNIPPVEAASKRGKLDRKDGTVTGPATIQQRIGILKFIAQIGSEADRAEAVRLLFDIAMGKNI